MSGPAQNLGDDFACGSAALGGASRGARPDGRWRAAESTGRPIGAGGGLGRSVDQGRDEIDRSADYLLDSRTSAELRVACRRWMTINSCKHPSSCLFPSSSPVCPPSSPVFRLPSSCASFVRVRVRAPNLGSQPRHILVSIATILASKVFASSASGVAKNPATRQTSTRAAHSIADPRAIARNRARSGAVGFPEPSAMFRGTDMAARLS